MPTPLGEGGTRLTGVKASSSGEISIDSQPITELYWYQPLRNGAAVSKMPPSSLLHLDQLISRQNLISIVSDFMENKLLKSSIVLGY